MNLNYPRSFWIMCWALLAFMTSFNLIIPELNAFITSLGGADLKGAIFILFALSALISRPFSGKLSDTIGRKKVMYLGIIFGAIVGCLYPIAGNLFFFLGLRFGHGFSAGFMPTGATALVTDLLKPHQRSVAMGIWGTFISVGFGLGNFFASPITQQFGLTALFLIAAAFCVLAGILISQVEETLPNPQPFSWSFLKVKWDDVFEPTVRPAAFVMACMTISTGVILTTTPDISIFLNIENKGWFFLFYMSSTILIRLFGSSLSDNIGRRKALILAFLFLAISMLVVATSTEWIQYTIGAIIFGISTGILSPTIMAWVADLSPEHRRGVGAGTLFIALEFGIIIGSLLPLFLYDNTMATTPILFIIGAFCALTAIIYLIWHLRNFESKT